MRRWWPASAFATPLAIVNSFTRTMGTRQLAASEGPVPQPLREWVMAGIGEGLGLARTRGAIGVRALAVCAAISGRPAPAGAA